MKSAFSVQGNRGRRENNKPTVYKRVGKSIKKNDDDQTAPIEDGRTSDEELWQRSGQREEGAVGGGAKYS